MIPKIAQPKFYLFYVFNKYFSEPIGKIGSIPLQSLQSIGDAERKTAMIVFKFYENEV